MSHPPTGPACGNNPNHPLTDGDRQAVADFKAYLTDRAALRDRIAEALYAHDHPGHLVPLNETGMEPAYRESANAVLAVLPPPADRAEAPLSPYYSHESCGFHWHGSDGMDIPMRDGQPVCPRCELAAVEKKLCHSENRREELRAESRRRGKVKLEYAEKIRELEKRLDEVRSQLGAEILRAGQAEAALDTFQRVVRRLANHAVGFQDVLDDSDRDPWARTVGADIAELRRMADEAQQPDTETVRAYPDCERCGDTGVDPQGGPCEDCQQPVPGPDRVADEEPAETQRPSPTEALLATRCDACRHALNRHHRHGACTVVLCVCGTFQYPVEELPQ